jgi:acyl carrier protein
MNTAESVKHLLSQTLQLGPRADSLTPDSQLLGALPELDSMAVVTILTAMEEHFGFVVDDDEISADTFATLGTLTDFVEQKLGA